MNHQDLIRVALDCGAEKATVISQNKVVTSASFRDICASDGCGLYGKCWMCPPDVGPIENLMSRLRMYRWCLVYQTISPLEDSFDFEGMQEAGRKHRQLSQRIRNVLESNLNGALFLGAGGCGFCHECAKRNQEPCRHPKMATASLEAYGIDVYRLAEAAAMQYTNGANTVTYFGAVFFNED